MASEDTTGPIAVPAGGLIEPPMAMALNVHSSPGVYALLLGAGVSIASGVKTGWGVVQDIVGKVAAVRNPDNPDARSEAMTDPESWWEANTSEPLGYSALLAAAAPMPASRQAMLAEYFEPEEGQEDSKGPTAAHRAIAQLVKRGSIRVILTTNFDRLTERALQEFGISPQVVSRPDQIKGIKPLTHSQVTVIKLHGDYADLEQRNTVDELETYPDELQQLLDRVLDEYGLVVCGWSADWDKALVRAIEGTRPRRYPLFWSQYGRFSDTARALTAQHNAVVIDGKNADELFTDLARRVEALDRLTTAPLTRDVAVVQLKRALPDPLRRIELFDLVDQAITQITGRSTPEHKPVSVLSAPGDDTFGSNVQGYRADGDTLLHLLANGVFHDDGTHDHVWRRAVERLVRLRDTTPSPYNEHLEKLRHLPALLATWTIGVAAVLSHREGLLATALYRPEWATPRSGRTRQKPGWYLNPNLVLDIGSMHDLHPAENGGKLYYPQSNWLKDTLREPFRLVEPSDIAYREACARFEFLASMIAMDTDSDIHAYPWAGEFLLDSTWGYENEGLPAIVETELTDTWPLLTAGAFGGQLPRAQNALTKLTEWKRNHARHW
ncbi:SIR2 family protein [Streptomyces globisporus]|uniref:SIR2 family protein n=1 Tax=Streptomyces globisporus TaxID=1908 RepID=UPI00131CA3CA|nr:SIR2 family protein [Streptomyces globisporus]